MSITIDEIWLEHLANRKAALLAEPFTPEASREVERIDVIVDAFWASIGAQVANAE